MCVESNINQQCRQAQTSDRLATSMRKQNKNLTSKFATDSQPSPIAVMLSRKAVAKYHKWRTQSAQRPPQMTPGAVFAACLIETSGGCWQRCLRPRGLTSRAGWLPVEQH